jgi:release factor glutamine methyltransferase
LRALEAEDLLERGESVLVASPSIDHWQRDRERIEAEELLAHALGHDFDLDDDISAAAARRFDALIERRATGEPIPYIKGYAEFRGLKLTTKPGVFVPRDSTEFMVEQAVRRLARRPKPIVVDIACGGGTVALAIAHEVPRAEVFGTDIAEDAVKLARANARRLGVRATFVRGDLFKPLPKRIQGNVDAITLHPPYVARGELRDLPDEVRRFEPAHTLSDRSVDGLGLVERTASASATWLRPGGWLVVEVSPDRSRGVASKFRAAGLTDVKSTKGGELKVTRVVLGRRPRD